MIAPKNLIIGNLCKNLSDSVINADAKSVAVIGTKNRLNSAKILSSLAYLEEKIGHAEKFVIPCGEPKDIVLQEMAKNIGTDVIIAIGGGSTIDSAKIIGVLSLGKQNISEITGVNLVLDSKPVIVVPTVSGSGSEATHIAVYHKTESNEKSAIVSPKITPLTVIIDKTILTTVPKNIAAYSGMDALSHAFESYVSLNANSFTKCISLSALRNIIKNLEKSVNANDAEAREELAISSFLAGVADANAGVGVTHALSYPIESACKIPHGLSIATLMPYALEHKLYGNYEVSCSSDFIKSEQIIKTLGNFIKNFGLPKSLQELGVQKSQIKDFSQKAICLERLLKNNPKISVEQIEKAYLCAYEGKWKYSAI